MEEKKMGERKMGGRVVLCCRSLCSCGFRCVMVFYRSAIHAESCIDSAEFEGQVCQGRVDLVRSRPGVGEAAGGSRSRSASGTYWLRPAVEPCRVLFAEDEICASQTYMSNPLRIRRVALSNGKAA